jgi:flagellar motor protein MotB
MAKAQCKCKTAECEECPEWIFTFADLVMLMMGFFVILWVLKPPAGKKGVGDKDQIEAKNQWQDTVGGIRAAFGYEPDPHSADPIDKRMLRPKPGRKDGAENNIPRETAVGTDHMVTSVRPGRQSVVGSRLAFDAGSARLLPETLQALDQIATKIIGHYNIVLVKGHSSLDDLPDSATAPQRMDLSLRRAQASADYLVSKGVSPEVLRVQGCSIFEPVKQRAYSADAQAENRRVEVEATSELVMERQDAASEAPAAAQAASQVQPPNTH